MSNLFPVFAIPQETAGEDTIDNYKTSAYFDFDAGDFKVNNKGIIVNSTPEEAWQQWCLKQVYTERFSLLGYSDNIGVEIEEAMLQSSRAAQQSMIEKTITEAILADPLQRTTIVGDFEFEWGNDNISISFNVTGKDNIKLGIQATI